MTLPQGETADRATMDASLSIGDFARATHLGIKTLRY
jgi:hypothetical protein